MPRRLLVKIICFGVKIPFVTEKEEETCFNAETNNFDQQTACGAPVWWSKYTTLVTLYVPIYVNVKM